MQLSIILIIVFKMMKRVTVFTPTYNRAYILPKLYKSLCEQTVNNFEWVIVDDGSADDTSGLVKQWMEEGKVEIHYSVQTNGGKHRAINRGVKSAQGELFLIVDSDDYLTRDAVEVIDSEWAKVSYRKDIVGMCFRKVNYVTGQTICKAFPKDKAFATTVEICYKWKVSGDKAEVFRTDVMRANPFPEIEGENFLTEAYVWHKIAGKRTAMLYCVDRGVYMCDYLPDGLTAHFMKLLRENPKGYIRYYTSLYRYRIVWLRPMVLVKISVRLLQSVFYCLCHK